MTSVPSPWRIATQSPIRIVGKANQISAQLAAFAPLGLCPNVRNISREATTSRQCTDGHSAPKAAAIPQAAADLEEQT